MRGHLQHSNSKLKIINMMVIFVILIFYDLVSSELTNRQKDLLVQIRKLIQNPPVEAWVYRDEFTSLQSMLIPDNILDKGLINDGTNTRAAIEKQLIKAMRGEDVYVYIFGESVSMGVQLDHVDFVFHHALAMWWNHTVGTVTGSFMKRRMIGIRGTMTKYMSKCWQEYLDNGEKFDLAILELNQNDRNDGDLDNTLEFFIRSIANTYNHTDLLMAVFYSDAYFDDAMYNTTREMSENIVANISAHYELTTINIENFFNASIFKKKTSLKKKIFDKKHPTGLAHAQMAISLMRYYTRLVREAIDTWMDKDNIETIITELKLPEMKNLPKNTTYKGTCWTATLVDVNHYSSLKHSLFSLPANGTKQVTAVMEVENGGNGLWNDSLGGYEIREDGELSIRIKVDDLNTINHCPIYLANVQAQQSHEAKIHVYGGNSSMHIDAFIFGAGRTGTQYVDEVASVHPGEWWVTINPYMGKFLLNAIIIC